MRTKKRPPRIRRKPRPVKPQEERDEVALSRQDSLAYRHLLEPSAGPSLARCRRAALALCAHAPSAAAAREVLEALGLLTTTEGRLRFRRIPAGRTRTRAVPPDGIGR